MWKAVLCLCFFTVLCMFSGFKNPGFISKHPGSPGFPTVDDPLKLLVACEEWVLFFCPSSLRFGLSNDCLSGSSASSESESSSSGSTCSQSEYFLLWGSQKAFTSWYLKLFTFNGGNNLMEFTEKMWSAGNFSMALFSLPWTMEVFGFHTSFGKEFCCEQNLFCLFELHKGYRSCSNDLHHFLKKKQVRV